MADGDHTDVTFRVERVASSLRHDVTDSIRTAIAVRRFQPGQRLIERELCEMTGVSRTLVREALRQLESEGLIAIMPNRGPVVRTFTPEQAKGVYDVRRELEGLAAAFFAERASDKQRNALEVSFQELKKVMTTGDPIQRLRAKNEFYERLLQGAANDALADTLRMLNSRVTFLRATTLQAEGRALRSLAELEQLMAALAAKDPGKARKIAAMHVENASTAAIAELKRSAS